MLKKFTSMLLLLLVLCGIVIAILNFLPVKAYAETVYGTTVYMYGYSYCFGTPRNCSITIE